MGRYKPIRMTEAEYRDLTEGLDNPGRCLVCGAEHFECEPDARKYRCDECGEFEVFGLEECLVMGLVEFVA